MSASASASNASLQSTGPKIIPYLRYLSQYGKVIIISRGARVSWGGGDCGHIGRAMMMQHIVIGATPTYQQGFTEATFLAAGI